MHLEDEQQIVFDEGNTEKALEEQRDTELTAFFMLNEILEQSEDLEENYLPS